jgi:hypothetical protein
VSERCDPYNLTARLEKFGDALMTAIENGEAIENRVDVCSQLNTVCRIVMTLKALRMEVRGADPDAAIAGSAVRKYANKFAAEPRRAASAGSAAEAASDPFIDDPAGPILSTSDLRYRPRFKLSVDARPRQCPEVRAKKTPSYRGFRFEASNLGGEVEATLPEPTESSPTSSLRRGTSIGPGSTSPLD